MVRALILGLIRFYRKAVSPWTPPACRFMPTCSAYAEEAVETHGALRGGWLALRRLLRCHPLGGSGVDLVPDSGGERAPDRSRKVAAAEAAPGRGDR